MHRVAVGILLFRDVEVLDFAGPYEVFSRTRLTPGVESRRSEESAPFKVFTVAAATDPVLATGGLRVIPDFDFVSAPPIELLVIPGGFGTRALLQDAGALEWVRRSADAARRVTSVCTGALTSPCFIANTAAGPYRVVTDGGLFTRRSLYTLPQDQIGRASCRERV